MSRQRWGQHFLSSPRILERIAAAACGEHAGSVVEIGPGTAALTEHLLPRVDRLIAIEIDPDLARELRDRYAHEPKLTVIHADALEQDFSLYAPDVICGNLPYYVATPLLERAARVGVPTVALIQKEVAERITAHPGTRDYGFLTCQIALFAEAKYLFSVKPGAFRPPPKVDSAVIRLNPRHRAPELGVDAEAFLRFLSECFRLKRKTLRNNLSATFPRERFDGMPQADLRAEQCSLADLAIIYRRLTEQ